MNSAASGLLFLLLALGVLEGPDLALRRKAGLNAPGRFLRRFAFESWACGVLASHLFVVRALARQDHGLEAIAREMVLALLPSLAGLAIAAFAGMRALGLADDGDLAAGAPGPGRPARWISSALLVALVGAVLAVSPARADPGLSPRTILLHPPALLVLTGAAVLLLRVFARRGAGVGVAPAIALATALACTAGLVQALLGFAERDLSRVTDGISFLLTGGFAGTLALVVAGRETPGGSSGSLAARTAGRVAWALVPLAGLLFLALAIVLVMTPMTVPG